MYASASTPTLVSALWPRLGVRRDAVLVLGGSVLTALAAQLSLPLPGIPVPLTGQTFAVLLVGALLGGRLGFLALTAYLLEGLAGLPVFALARGAWSPSAVPGVPWILGPTAGYLLALPLAAGAVGWLAERGWDRRFLTAAPAMLLGNAIIFSLGMLWLGRFVGLANAVPLGLLPFLPGDALKLLLAALALPSGWAVLGRLGLR
ncbi:MAG: biotin transporter BioY [Chloroflexi bacterium]|nr:biotin transporter BioY [Chloroflexota bacterium]MCL5111123.1 biotin transporter BioY [Chloroflexota bacterium]